ncbi:hypothetical protein FWF48_03405 [Candidatus Saccharibacteria bacterium]|nr:hypothetical protein [Candidatus Saccharibacteria bacterium]
MMEKDPEKQFEFDRVFGECPRMTIPVDWIVAFPQVRGDEENPMLAEITASIDEVDLINDPNVALFSPEMAQDQLDFANELCGTNVQSDEILIPKHIIGGRYPCLIAGHTRQQGMHDLQERDQNRCGVSCKIHKIDDPWDFIKLQWAENKHSKPSIEQRASNLMNTYLYGKRHDLWDTAAGFREQWAGEYSSDIVNDVVNFANLPPQARDYVFARVIPYQAGVALGRDSKTILEYVFFNLERSGDKTTAENIHEAYAKEVDKMALYIASGQAGGGCKTNFKIYQRTHSRMA